jgi:cysteine desulfurase
VDEVYFDNAATTRVDDEVITQMTDVMKNEYGNPSSLHTRGVQAQLRMERASHQVEKALGMKSGRLYFTSGGTEANNLALFGAADARHRLGNRIITTKLEHSSVLQSAEELKRRGFDVVELDCDRDGRVSLDALRAALTDQTILVSMMLVNNEVGTIQPVREAAALVHRQCPNALVHSDAVQAFGKIPFDVSDLKVDLLSISGHKIHAPKGVGALYVADKVRIKPILFGGGQQEGIRPGTESVPLICALGTAAHEAKSDLPATTERLTALRRRLLAGLSDMENVVIHTPDEGVSPFILNISVTGYRSETMLHFLAQRNIFVSSGSACSKGAHSHVLDAMGCSPAEIDSALRLSFSKYSDAGQADWFLESLHEAVSTLRRA